MIDRRVITDVELNRFVSGSHYVHYMKTAAWGAFKARTENSTYHCLGFFEDDTLKATAMVIEHSFLGHRYLYVPKGPCLDYEDDQLREDVIRSLEEYAQNRRVQFLRIDPDVIRVSRDINGNQIDGIDHEYITEDLKRLGFVHRGYNYAYDGSWTNRYTLIIDIDKPEEEIHAGFSKQRRTSLNRHQISGVSTAIGSSADIPSLMKFEAMLSEMDGFKPHSESFFQNLLASFEGHVRLYVTSIDLNTMIEGITAELNSKKYRKDPEAKATKEKDLVHAGKLMKQYGSSLPIACGIFLYYGDMSWDLYTYNHKAFNFIKPVDNLHAFAIADLRSLGVKRYDMCGFSGVTTKDDPEYGLYSYKRSFGPEFIEQIGEFDYVLNERAYRRFRKEKSLEVRARHKLWRMRYKKDQTK